MRWAYAVTTVPERRHTTLPRTLDSLATAGFDKPRLFVDGLGRSLASGRYSELVRSYEDQFPHLELAVRWPNLRTHGHWFLTLHELFQRDPNAERFAVFQDDFVTYRNLRSYLERVPYPDKAYLNLYTFTATNEPIIRGKPPGWYEAGLLNSPPGTRWQAGRGAVALVFSNQAAQVLLSAPQMLSHATDKQRGWRKVDGAIVNAMNQAGWREYVHAPSLVQHTGQFSSMGSMPLKYAESFLGEEVDALTFLEQR